MEPLSGPAARRGPPAQTAASADASETFEGGTEGHSAKDAPGTVPKIKAGRTSPGVPAGNPVVPGSALYLFWRKNSGQEAPPRPSAGDTVAEAEGSGVGLGH